MVVRRGQDSSRSDYHDPDKRSIANAVQVFFKDGSAPTKSPSSIRSATGAAAPKASRCSSEKPAPPLLHFYGKDKAARLASLFTDRRRARAMPVHEFAGLFPRFP